MAIPKKSQSLKRGAPKTTKPINPVAKKAKVEVAGKRRAVPITAKTPILESEGSDEEAWEDEAGGKGEAEIESGDEGVEEDGAMKVDKPPKDPQGKPRKHHTFGCTKLTGHGTYNLASREGHKVQKELQAQRRAAKPHSALLTEAKRVWALARSTDIPRTERQKHVADLMGVLRGSVQDIVFKHDASRIVQTVSRTHESFNRVC
jgi:pumilio family protein 6